MKVAVVGGGIAGLTAAWLLSKRHEVELFEAAPRAGGHTYTVEVDDAGRRLAVDMGFIVFNDWTYPLFIRLLDELGVASQPSSMSFSVRCETSGLEYNGTSINQLFAQRRNLLSVSFLRMLWGILRFHRRAPRLLAAGAADPTLGQYLREEGYSRPFIERYLVPMAASIWSTEPRRLMDYPARTLASFLHNHGMLSVNQRPQWRTVRGGSRTYLAKLEEELGGRIRCSQEVEKIERHADSVTVRPRGGKDERFDHVVLATHSDQALRMLADPSAGEAEILGSIPYQDNEVVLHTDRRLLPERRLAWASWNYHLDTSRPASGVQLTYYMNELQSLDSERHYCVTLNRSEGIDPAKVLHRTSMAHPLFTQAAIRAQQRWSEISNLESRTSYCGAYWGYGFHEDGVRSAVRVAAALGVDW